MRVNIFGAVSDNAVIEQTTVSVNGPAPATHNSTGDIDTGTITDIWIEGFE
jgi:hypothetical protein